MPQTHTWDVAILAGGEYCQWVTDQGGPTALDTTDYYSLLQACYEQVPCCGSPPGYTFIPTTKHLFGTIQYLFGNITGGNTTTGCEF